FEAAASSFDGHGGAKVRPRGNDESGSLQALFGRAAAVVRADSGGTEEKHRVVPAGDCRRSELCVGVRRLVRRLLRLDRIRGGHPAETSVCAGGGSIAQGSRTG